jgi:hypothetical protein
LQLEFLNIFFSEALGIIKKKGKVVKILLLKKDEIKYIKT